MADWGFSNEMNSKYLIHDRDSKFCDSFREIIISGAIERRTRLDGMLKYYYREAA